jgi:predicted transglutaminase-like cysteine proteinase
VRAAGGIPVVDDRVVLSSRLMARIAAVNMRVNRSMKPRIDAAWHVGGASGDCKDYALTKRSLLDGIGFPTAATLIATARETNGQMHAVLVVRTDQGDLILDNLTNAIRPWRAANYLWESIQSPADPAIWQRIETLSVAALR